MAHTEKSSNKRLAGKVAIVTGAGRGIGRAEAMLLAQQGAAVVVNDLGGGPTGGGADDRIASLVAAEMHAAGGNAVANFDNVATMEGGARIIQTAIDAFGHLDILINNAGIVRPRIIYNMSEDDWDDVIAVHLKGHFSTIRAAAMIFREQKSGVIVNTASESGLGHLGQSSYSAAKEGIVGLTRTIARDLGKFNVRCNAIRPRAATRLLDEAAVRAMERTRAMLGDRGVPVPMPNPLDNKPEQVAALAVWLCTDAAANVNGRTFVVGGELVGLYPEPEPIRTMIHENGWDLDALDRTAPAQLIAGLRNEFIPRS
ncbi:MAG TPA: SDR family NAD(P)-dependent oxidoreductase [Candidatus Binataceae bacterium]|nr:SDR family NAD(P)-dependent oxidoreductase [Candidatus Binataceae bacterium]